MSENIVFGWAPDFYLKLSDFKAESNPAIFEDSHSVIKYRFTWTLNSDIINDHIVFLIENVHLIVEFHSLLSWPRFRRPLHSVSKNCFQKQIREIYQYCS